MNELLNLRKHYSRTENCVPTADLKYFKVTEEFINTVEIVASRNISSIVLTGGHGVGKMLFAKALAFVLDIPCTVTFTDRLAVANETL